VRERERKRGRMRERVGRLGERHRERGVEGVEKEGGIDIK
jgi:hypothetical protein